MHNKSKNFHWPLVISILFLSFTALANESTDITIAKSDFETMVVTATKEEKSIRDLPESVNVFNADDIALVSPSHPSDILNRSPGVHINNLGGEGHMTAIRQPITTRGVYLFLEDGVPTRPTGFFNHNGLYEVNIPQSGNLEVTKGPASALYGSDGVGGVINSITAPPPKESTYMISPEVGSYGWKRLLVSGGGSNEEHGVIFKANVTDNDGYRDESDYQRESLTGRWDYAGGRGFSTKTTFSVTQVDQSGVSSLEEADYRDETKKNLYHGKTGFREVEALRVTSEFNFEQGEVGLLTLTPFYRDNTTTMAPSWMVTYDPSERETEFRSYGLLAKYRYNISEDTQFISGIDVDYTPSSYRERAVSHNLDGEIYLGYSYVDGISYLYDADQTSVSPYLQLEMVPIEKLTFSLGLRYDYFEVDYTDKLGNVSTVSEIIPQLNRPVNHARPENQKLSFDEVSPKLGLVYQLRDTHDTYLNYRHAFRAPSVGSLFRSGTTLDTDKLEPVSADSYEVGFRGVARSWLYYELAIYYMEIKDDIVTVANGSERNIYNAGETHHKGIEVLLNGDITTSLAYSFSYTVTKQTYETFSYRCCRPAINVDVSGNDVGKAPKTIGNFILLYSPDFVEGLTVETEIAHIGRYYTDETNTNRYPGHNLLNLRTSYDLSEQITVYGRVSNVGDKRYSVYTSNQVNDDDISYRLGLPRTYTFGARVLF